MLGEGHALKALLVRGAIIAAAVTWPGAIVVRAAPPDLPNVDVTFDVGRFLDEETARGVFGLTWPLSGLQRGVVVTNYMFVGAELARGDRDFASLQEGIDEGLIQRGEDVAILYAGDAPVGTLRLDGGRIVAVNNGRDLADGLAGISGCCLVQVPSAGAFYHVTGLDRGASVQQVGAAPDSSVDFETFVRAAEAHYEELMPQAERGEVSGGTPLDLQPAQPGGNGGWWWLVLGLIPLGVLGVTWQRRRTAHG